MKMFDMTIQERSIVFEQKEGLTFDGLADVVEPGTENKCTIYMKGHLRELRIKISLTDEE